jgi:hypothetical protein
LKAYHKFSLRRAITSIREKTRSMLTVHMAKARELIVWSRKFRSSLAWPTIGLMRLSSFWSFTSLTHRASTLEVLFASTYPKDKQSDREEARRVARGQR